MDLNGKTCVITGAAGGIGRALSRRFHAAGANVLVTDIDAAGAGAVAAELDAARPGSAASIGGSVAREGDVVAGIDLARATWGAVDLYWANAGVAAGTDLETPDDVWDLAWGVNTKAHYYAARHLVPDWLAAGEGYFCSTASAAGLLTQIGSAPYTLTKHAAVAFAEWMAVTYGDRGVRVSCLCPQGVNTDMLNGGVASTGADAVRAGGAVLEPEDVAAACLDAVVAERFLVLPHPEVLTYWQRKTSDIDRWLGGMRRLQARLAGG
jgi:NAD(P)-dependent dehydrogenase (short-subunit alcohol dehydrogenase family)